MSKPQILLLSEFTIIGPISTSIEMGSVARVAVMQWRVHYFGLKGADTNRCQLGFVSKPVVAGFLCKILKAELEFSFWF